MISCNSRVLEFRSPYLVPIRKTWTVQWKELTHTGKSWLHSQGLKLSNWEKNILFLWNIYEGDRLKHTVVQSSSLCHQWIWCNVFSVYLTICRREYDQLNLKQATGTELTGSLLFGTKAFIHVYACNMLMKWTIYFRDNNMTQLHGISKWVFKSASILKRILVFQLQICQQVASYKPEV